MSVTALGFVLIFFVLLALAFVRHPVYGLLGYLWAFYNPPNLRWWGEGLPELRWSLLAALVTFVAAFRLKAPDWQPAWYKNWGARLLIIFTAWMWLQIAWAVNRNMHMEGAILFTKYLILFYIIYKIVADEKTFELFSLGHVVGCFIFGWIAWRTHTGGRFESVGGPGVDDANTLAMHMVTGLVFAGFLFLGLRDKRRWLAFVCIPFILNGIILTSSRGAMLSLAFAAIVALVWGTARYRKWIVLSVCLGAVALVWLSDDRYWERFDTIFEKTQSGEYEASAQSRLDLINYGFQMVKDYPLGAGHRGHAVISANYLPSELLTGGSRSAHNTFMGILVEQGYPGAVFFSLLQIWIFIELWRLRQLANRMHEIVSGQWVTMLAVAFSASFIGCQFGNYLKAEVLVWLLALFAVLRPIYQVQFATLFYQCHIVLDKNISSDSEERFTSKKDSLPFLGNIE